ncbi:MAG: hypothetical protein QM723_07895 [Myxococcaceae bacterium]
MRTRLIVMSLCLSLASAASADEGCKVIVNSGNPLASIDREKLSRIFLKKQSHWDSGEAANPVDQADGAAREAFSRTVLDKTPGAVKSYWQQLIFSGRDVPPPQKQSDLEVVEFVKNHPGAVGYVSASAPADGVKILKVEGAKP